MNFVAKQALKLCFKEHNAASDLSNQLDQEMPDFLRSVVEDVAIKRDMVFDKDSNISIANYMERSLLKYCDWVSVESEGEIKTQSIVAGWGEGYPEKAYVIGGHYDGPAGSPGADDNGSALATLIAVAKELQNEKPKNIVLVAFNGEERGLLGSSYFAQTHDTEEAVILEMVGYYTDEPNSQEMPDILPPMTVGNFLAIIGNKDSGSINSDLLKVANQSNLTLPLKSLKIPLGLETSGVLSNVQRSDHYPFWKENRKAVMLTDTAEFRNRNYHQPTDTPETLNYTAMCEVVNLLKKWALTK